MNKFAADILLLADQAHQMTEQIKAADNPDELEILAMRRLYVALGDLVVELAKIPGVPE